MKVILKINGARKVYENCETEINGEESNNHSITGISRQPQP